MKSKFTFTTAINCMDGRVQIPVIEWMKQKFNAQFVDMITEPGPDKILSKETSEMVNSIRNRVLISVEKHGSKVITITGHADCAGNPVSKEIHIEHIQKSIETIKLWNLPVTVIGLWINENWEIEEINYQL